MAFWIHIFKRGGGRGGVGVEEARESRWKKTKNRTVATRSRSGDLRWDYY